MIYYCKLKVERIPAGKVLHYCLKRNCWALKMLKNSKELARLERLAKVKKKVYNNNIIK